MRQQPPPRISEAMLDEIRTRLPIDVVVGRAVQLKREGAWLKGLCPFHAERNPSFTVRRDTRNFHCFGCGLHGDVISFVMRHDGVEFLEAVQRCAAEAGLAGEVLAAALRAPWVQRKPLPMDALPEAEQGPTPAERTAMARRIWDAGSGIGATGPVARYLAGRGLWPLPFPCHAVLREGEARHRRTGDRRHPVMLARIDAPDGSFSAVHRTFLAPRTDDGWGKLSGAGDPRLSLGPIRGCAVRLFPAAPQLGVAEGIETALAAFHLSGMPVWSCLNAGNLGTADLPFEVEGVTIFADRDRPRRRGEDGYKGPDMPEGAGIFAARALDGRLQRLAVATTIRAPASGDYADVWLARQQEAAA